ncbi:MAG: RluA family pseudouridine synthase [Selenomonadaceae bacterium]|nr:RluA family pseudouridine synthase [Selenomonadaceae bacterium]
MMGEAVYRADRQGERLDVFLARQESGLSRAHVQKLILEGHAWVNGSACKPNCRLKGGEAVRVLLPEPEAISVEPEQIPLDILYEDEDIIVVNKARGMVVHPAAGVCHGTLVNALLYHCKDLSGINGKIRPGIVHRLDKDTSGVMVAAKNDRAHLDLAEQIGTKSAHRKYLAIVHGNIREEKGIIKGDIGRHPVDRKKMAIVRENGKPAVTEFNVLQRFGEYTLVACSLQTGRTHQIRVHMAHIGHPLAGDPKYGPRKKAPFAIEGQALHSASLSFAHPGTGEFMQFEAPLPEDMRNILETLEMKMGRSR